MTDNLFAKRGLLIAGFLATPLAVFGATTLAQWTFEKSKPMTALGQNNGRWTNPVGNGSGESWSSSQWTGGDHFQFMVDGTGRDFLDITWSHISSSTGPLDFSLSYSLDGVKLVWLADYQVMANATPNNWSYSAPIADSRYGMEIQFDQAWKGPIYFRITSVSGVAPSGARPEGIWSRVSEYTVAGAPGPPFLAA